MKKLLFLAAISLIGLASCKKRGCTDPEAINYSSEAEKLNKSCNYTPFIFLSGDATMEILVGTPFSDPGASAIEKNGDPAELITDLSQVNTASVGSFDVTYTATNEFGTTTLIRTVNVIVGQQSWIGAPTATSPCNFSPFGFNENATISAGATESDIVIEDVFVSATMGTSINAIVDGQSITIPQQTISNPLAYMYISGVGTMNSEGTQFTVDYSYSIFMMNMSTYYNCTITYDF